MRAKANHSPDLFRGIIVGSLSDELFGVLHLLVLDRILWTQPMLGFSLNINTWLTVMQKVI